ncbi:dopamine receptor 2-like [Ptychodera flava]|uniref:dopamine receptor 2-like n=1 Tax=Ptychodera flava TaxID=63121 RepID=UPI00396A8A8B
MGKYNGSHHSVQDSFDKWTASGAEVDDNGLVEQASSVPTDQTWLIATSRPLVTENMHGSMVGPVYHIISDSDNGLTNLSVNFSLEANNTTSTSIPFFNDDEFAAEPLTIKQPILAAFLTIFSAVIVFGNTLVILAVYRERYLRTTTNCFIVSLAFADLLIGLVVVPFAIINDTSGGNWQFGQLWCDLWHALDVLSSTASIMNLCVISLDRYWAVTYPMSYPTNMTKKIAFILISLVWTCSAAISFPCIFWWKAVDPPMPPNTCLFTEDAKYLIISACVSFYIPTVIMIFTYYKIYRAASTQLRHIRHGTKRVNASPGARSLNGEVELRIHRGGAAHAAYGKKTGRRGVRRDAKGFVALTGRRLLSRISKEHKAAKMLGIVMGVFEICWMPFFISNNILWALCRADCVAAPHIVLPIVTWLGYFNSAFNPMIYARSSRGFKRAFKRILCTCWPKISKFKKKEGIASTMELYSVDSYVPDTSGAQHTEDDDNASGIALNTFKLPHQYF